MLPYMKILPTICYCATALLVSWIFSANGRFQLRDISGVPYVINQNSGEMWKFYFVPAENGNRSKTGFERVVLP